MLSTWYSASQFTPPTPVASSLFVRHADTQTSLGDRSCARSTGWFARGTAEADADDGDLYWFVADAVGPLLDPDAMDVVMTAEGRAAWCARPGRSEPSLGSAPHDPVVYELHVRGFGKDVRRLHRSAAICRRPRGQRRSN